MSMFETCAKTPIYGEGYNAYVQADVVEIWVDVKIDDEDGGGRPIIDRLNELNDYLQQRADWFDEGVVAYEPHKYYGWVWTFPTEDMGKGGFGPPDEDLINKIHSLAFRIENLGIHFNY